MFSFIFPPFARQPLITRFWKCARELNHINVYSMQRLSSQRCAIKKKQLSVKFKLNESFCFRWKDSLALISMVPTINKKKKEGKDVLETPWGCATSECWSLCEAFFEWWEEWWEWEGNWSSQGEEITTLPRISFCWRRKEMINWHTNASVNKQTAATAMMFSLLPTS